MIVINNTRLSVYTSICRWTGRAVRQDVCVCVCIPLSGMFADIPKVLILGAIAAASAFVVTILIVLVCVGCQR